MTVMSGYTAGSGMWRLSLPPIPSSPPSHPRSLPPRSSYQEKRHQQVAPVRATTAACHPGAASHLEGTRRPERLDEEEVFVRQNLKPEPLPDEPEGDGTNVAGLESKLAALQAELDLERTKGQRGSNRFMGGGQFKSGTPSNRIRQCPVCFNLRETISKMRSDHEDLQETNAMLQKQLREQQGLLDESFGNACAGDSAMKQRLHQLEMQRDEMAVKLEQDRQMHHSQQQQLRVQLQTECTTNAQQHAQIIEFGAERSAAAAREDALLKELQDLKRELQRCRDRVSSQEVQLNQTWVDLKQMTEQMNHHKATSQRYEKQVNTLTIEVEHLRGLLDEGGAKEDAAALQQQQINQLKQQLERVRVEYEIIVVERDGAAARADESQHNLEQAEQRLADGKHESERLRVRVEELLASNQELQKVTQELLQQIAELEASKAEAGEASRLAALVATLQAEVASLNAQLAALMLELSQLKVKAQDQAIELQHKDTVLRQAKTHSENLQDSLNKLRQELELLRQQLATALAAEDALRQQAEREEEERRKLAAAKAGAEKEAKEALEEVDKLRKDKAKKEKTILDLMQKNQDDLEKERKDALEKTMQSMVRLCVVAPTVNVSFGNDQITCKAGLPGDAIRDIIERQILPGFIQLFLQPKEGLGPEGSDLGKWVEKLMADMQGSIEKHLSGVFN